MTNQTLWRWIFALQLVVVVAFWAFAGVILWAALLTFVAVIHNEYRRKS